MRLKPLLVGHWYISDVIYCGKHLNHELLES